MKRMFLLLASAVIVSGTACQSSRSSQVYTREQARKVHTVKLGVVEMVREVEIEGTKSPVGTIAGGAAGGAIGNTIGGGSGNTVATVVGAIGGAIIGSFLEEKITKKKGLEITVKLEGGEVIAIVQEAYLSFYVVDKVQIFKDS